jgi:hypothetical protein
LKLWRTWKDRYILTLEREVAALRHERRTLVETLAEIQSPGTARRVQALEFERQREERIRAAGMEKPSPDAVSKSIDDLKGSQEPELQPGFLE